VLFRSRNKSEVLNSPAVKHLVFAAADVWKFARSI
jgi:hypothetical protein